MMRLLTAAWIGAFLLLACGGGEEGTEVEVASLRVEPGALQLVRLEVARLEVEALDPAGRALPGVAVLWSSEDPAVATVDASGVVRGLAPGRTTLNATAGGGRAEVPVEVREAVWTELAIPPEVQVVEGASLALALALEVRDERGVRYPEPPVLWEVEDPSVATVDEAGVVHGVRRGRTTTVTAVVGPLRATTEVRVLSPLFFLEVAPAKLELIRGATGALAAIPRDEQLRPVEERPVRWWSSDPSVVAVDDEGRVEARSEGRAQIWAEGEGKRNHGLVEVLPRATILEPIVQPRTLRVGGRVELRVLVTDERARRYEDVTPQWRSSDPAVVEVIGGQVAEAIAEGTATLTVTEATHGLEASVSVQVLEGGTLVLTGAGEGLLEAGATYQLGLGFQREDGTILQAADPTFHSYDESVAIVGPDGTARIVGVGRATIRIEAEGHVLSVDRLAAVRFVEMSLGEATTCGLTRHGSAWCWGETRVARAGGPRPVPQPIPALAAEGLISIRPGLGACVDFPVAGRLCDVHYGLTAEGEAIAWALGLEPVPVPTAAPFVAFDAFGSELCGVTAAGALICGDGPVHGASVVGAHVRGGGRCALLEDGRITCGGLGPFDVDLSPWEFSTEGRSPSLSIGSAHGCAVERAGALVCWGANEGEQLRAPADEAWHEPAPIGTARAVGGRPDKTIWIEADGWSLGARGTGVEDPGGAASREDLLTDMESELARFSPPAPLRSIFVGPGGHRCVLTEGGRPFCWGANHKGQTGRTPQTIPFTDFVVPVLLPVSPYPEN